VVLAYHRIEEPTTFRRQVEYLSRSRTIVSAWEVLDACRSPGKALSPDAVLITFDDADRTLLQEGLPVLREYGAPALAFVVAGHLGTRRPFWWREVELLLEGGAIAAGYPANSQDMVRVLKSVPDAERRRAVRHLRRSAPAVTPEETQLTGDELKTLREGGIEIGNHTMTHPILDRCSPRRIRSEILRAHGKLTDIMGSQIRAFAYPNGNWHFEAERVLRELEYQGAFLFDHRCSDFPPQNRFRISRVRVGSGTPLGRFRLIVSGLHPMIHHAAGRS
jgi:peptidoglycan/xylan/chitin deacetylase (PgdA/CDA1 family)